MAKKKSTNKPASQAITDAANALSVSLSATNLKNPPPPPAPKDKEELDLEKLVFGDTVGFQEALREGLEDEDEDEDGYSKYRGAGDEAGAGDADGIIVTGGNEDLTAVNDDELFYFDTGVPGNEVAVRDAEGDLDLLGEGAKGEATAGPKPAWEDSDDERVVVSLMSQNRLKKYRETFTDDVISGAEYIHRLRTQYERVYPVPTWALPQRESKRRRVLHSDDDDGESTSSSEIEGLSDDDDRPTSAAPLADLLQTTEGYITRTSPSSTRLKPGTLDITRLTDANHLSPSHSAITTLSFHPTHPLLLTSGFDHTLRLYHIDTKTNPPLSSLYIPSAPISTASFHPDATRVFAAGRRPFYHIWDLETGQATKCARLTAHGGARIRSAEHFKLSPCGAYLALLGKGGEVHVLSASTAQWIATAHVDGVAVDMAWYASSPHTPGLTIANKAGEIFEYDLAARAVSARWLDEGGVNTSCIALSGGGGGGGGGDKYLAVGSASGVVNVYDRTPITKGTVGRGEVLKPVRALGQLVTRVGGLQFSPDGQVLVMSSRAKKDALRLGEWILLLWGLYFGGWRANLTVNL